MLTAAQLRSETYLDVEGNADEHIPAYRDDDSHEVNLWTQAADRQEIR